jgi:hypothetical protein
LSRRRPAVTASPRTVGIRAEAPVVIVVAVVAEGIALMAPPPGSGLTKHLDDHKMTIASGFALTIVLYLLFEAIF